eukprot:TRINITY_DN22148_c0_g1_i1.p1 TRINITY_DN22148_c0_g1~~TRINITY_DN22148_c0_g1_i1.p1  ORF type:complete len:265 (+),score=38.62 TRINITY_DN22148_c0_g1_i1:241-1035(+)
MSSLEVEGHNGPTLKVTIDMRHYKSLAQWKDFLNALFSAALIDPIMAMFDPMVSSTYVVPLVAILLGLTALVAWFNDLFDFADTILFLHGLNPPNKDQVSKEKIIAGGSVTFADVLSRFKMENLSSLLWFLFYWIAMLLAGCALAMGFSDQGISQTLKLCGRPGSVVDHDFCLGAMSIYIRWIVYSASIAITLGVFFFRLGRAIRVTGANSWDRFFWKLFSIGIAANVHEAEEDKEAYFEAFELHGNCLEVRTDYYSRKNLKVA